MGIRVFRVKPVACTNAPLVADESQAPTEDRA